jgi:small subunit ribosomal protein S17
MNKETKPEQKIEHKRETKKTKAVGPVAKTKEKTSGCDDRLCCVHGSEPLKLRGRVFEGTVVSKFPKRIAIEFERVVSMRKYERYEKRKTRLHARLFDCMKDEINIGDYVRIEECRPLSKIIHFVVTKKIRSGSLKERPEDSKLPIIETEKKDETN